MCSHTLRAAPGTPVSPLSGGRGDDEAEASITHYPLDGLLPPGQSLAFHRGLGTLAHLTVQEDRAVVLGEQQFTEAEITLLVPLLDHYPYHCPYEVLWTSFAWNTTESRPSAGRAPACKRRWNREAGRRRCGPCATPSHASGSSSTRWGWMCSTYSNSATSWSLVLRCGRAWSTRSEPGRPGRAAAMGAGRKEDDMLLSKKIKIEVSEQDAQALEWMQGKCRGRAL